MISLIGKSVHHSILRRAIINSSAVTRSFCDKIENAKNSEENVNEEKKLGGFAKAYEKFSKPAPIQEKAQEPVPRFATLFKNSKFVEVKKIFFFININLIFLYAASSEILKTKSLSEKYFMWWVRICTLISDGSFTVFAQDRQKIRAHMFEEHA